MLYLIVLLLFVNSALQQKLVETNEIYPKFEKSYEPTWDSLDSRPLPEWFDKAKIGIFLHWGVFSVPSFGSEWFWMSWKGRNQSAYVDFMKKSYPPNFTYQDFARDFTAEFFNATKWAKLFKKAGAKYIVLTSKHHEGFTLWPSKYSYSWNAMDVGPNRDLIAELSGAVRKEGLTFGLYHSLYEWFHPLYVDDKNSNFTKSNFVHLKALPEMTELVENYKPDVIWSDGDWEASEDYWQSKQFLAWLYNDSPVKDSVVVNDRWGIDVPCKHGDFFSCHDRFNPGVLQKHKWENAMTIDTGSWGYRRNANVEDFLTTHALIQTLIETVSCGGNLLMNVGPTKEGTIIPIYQERLLDVGTWLGVNGDAIYESVPWKVQNDSISQTWYTNRGQYVYALTLAWPENNSLLLGSTEDLFKASQTVKLLGYDVPLEWTVTDQAVVIQFPDKSKVSSEWAWTLQIG